MVQPAEFYDSGQDPSQPATARPGAAAAAAAAVPPPPPAPGHSGQDRSMRQGNGTVCGKRTSCCGPRMPGTAPPSLP